MKTRLTMKRAAGAMLISVLALSAMLPALSVSAKEKTEAIAGDYYEFEKGSKYEITDANSSNSVLPLGTFSLSGDYELLGSKDDCMQYDVASGDLSLSYVLDAGIFEKSGDEWHLCEDSTKQVDAVSLDEKIKTGALIIQTSLDGERWVTDVVRTDIFNEAVEWNDEIYSTKDIQLVNGCYYKVILAYEQEIVQGATKVLSVSIDKKEYRKLAEVYCFYAINTKEHALSNQNASPRKELGERVGCKKDTGYKEVVSVDLDDPHYGWNLGTFTVNGYTRETTDNNGNSLFLKNVGDKVTLWFHLIQDIECLNGNEKLSIAEDKDGYDQYFGVKKTNFKHGALIIQYTDYEGVKHEPIIYTDFLAADAMTGADTQAVLFEEGDYEVALDYEIKNDKTINSYTDYRISFKFSIRNGNTMVFPFDLKTGAELRDNTVTANGFRLDLARSRYLNIDVQRAVVAETDTGHTLDVRFNRPAKDGDAYNEDGIYTVSVTNPYTNEHTTKTFYVGNDPVMLAMAKTGLTLKEIDEQIAEGVQLKEDGTLITPTPVEEEIIEETPEEEPETEAVSEQGITEPEAIGKEGAELTYADSEKELEDTESEEAGATETENPQKSVGMLPFVLFGVVAGAIVGGCFYLSGKKKSNAPQEAESSEGNLKGDREQ